MTQKQFPEGIWNYPENVEHLNTLTARSGARSNINDLCPQLARQFYACLRSNWTGWLGLPAFRAIATVEGRP